MGWLGMTGTGNWTTQRPESWVQGIFKEKPNGDFLLTGISSMMKSQKVDDPHFHWWTTALPTNRATITGVYINAALTTAYVYATHASTHGIVGGVIYLKMSAADLIYFVPGVQVVLRDSDRPFVDVAGKVIARVENGASSYIAVKLLVADGQDATPDTYNLSSVDVAIAYSSMQPEGSPMPESITHAETEYENYTQIIETSLSMTRTAMRTKLNTKEAYNSAKVECLEQQVERMEKAKLFGVPWSGVGDNNQKERSTMGWFYFLKTYASGNVSDYATATEYAGKTWLQGGKTWLDNMLKTIFTYGENEKLGVCGNGALYGVNALAESFGTINLEVNAPAYGIKVKTWEHPTGTLHLKTHPLFNYEPTLQYAMLIVEPQQMRRRVIDDVTFKGDSEFNGGISQIDGRNESYIVEEGYEFYYPLRHGLLYGVGLDSII